MKIACLVLICFASAPVYAQDAPHTARELRDLLAKAKTEAEFKTLATYYRLQGNTFSALAEERKKEWESELNHPTGGTKYPTGAERARQLYQSYHAKADQAFKASEEYDQRAKDAGALVEKH